MVRRFQESVFRDCSRKSETKLRPKIRSWHENKTNVLLRTSKSTDTTQSNRCSGCLKKKNDKQVAKAKASRRNTIPNRI